MPGVRLRIDLAYDGGSFHGWARQPGLRTVQGEIEQALDTVLRTAGSSLTVAGRTDSGVNARGQVAHVDLAEEALARVVSRSDDAPVDALRRRLNGLLGSDVRLRRVSLAPQGFDARFSAVWRRYAYRIADRVESVDPLARGHVLARPRSLDEARMNQAALALLGENDFAAFCRKRAGATTIRTLIELVWAREPDGLLTATVRADAFCHTMVRSLVGCLIEVGEGRREPGWAAEVLGGRTRHSAVRVARPHGLTLEEVGYPADDAMAAQAERSRVVRTLG
ncbi:MAG: tRNA pseudouridine(38-40) synthase TruA [Marmoricola sp.]